MTDETHGENTEHTELMQRISTSLTESAPRDWKEIRVTFRGSSTICQVAVSGTTNENSQLLSAPPREIVDLMRELREAMYQPGRGTWFSAQVRITRNTGPEFTFNFDEDPIWSPPVAPTLFKLDQERYPRDAPHIPDWLRARLDEAEAFEAEYGQQADETT